MKTHKVTIELPSVKAPDSSEALEAVVADLARLRVLSDGFEVSVEEHSDLELVEGVSYEVTYKRAGNSFKFTGSYEGSGFGAEGAGHSFYDRLSRQYLIVSEEDISKIKGGVAQ